MSHIIRISDWAYEQLKGIKGRKITNVVDMLIHSYFIEHSGGPSNANKSSILNSKLSDYISGSNSATKKEHQEQYSTTIPKPPSEIIVFSILLAWSNGILNSQSITKSPVNYHLLEYKNDDINTILSRNQLLQNSYKILQMYKWDKRFPEFFEGSSLLNIHWRASFSIAFSSCLKKLREIKMLESIKDKGYRLSYQIEQETIESMNFLLSYTFYTKNIYRLTKPYSFQHIELEALEGKFIKEVTDEIENFMDIRQEYIKEKPVTTRDKEGIYLLSMAQKTDYHPKFLWERYSKSNLHMLDFVDFDDYIQAYNRGMQQVLLDKKKSTGKTIMDKILEKADAKLSTRKLILNKKYEILHKKSNSTNSLSS